MPNNGDRSLNMRGLIKRRREERERRVKKKEKTGQPKLTFEINEQVIYIRSFRTHMLDLRRALGKNYNTTQEFGTYTFRLKGSLETNYTTTW